MYRFINKIIFTLVLSLSLNYLTAQVLIQQQTFAMTLPFNYIFQGLNPLKVYYLQVEGTYGFAFGQQNFYDATYHIASQSYYPGEALCRTKWQLNGSCNQQPFPFQYQPSHIYKFLLPGSISQFNISFHDCVVPPTTSCNYGDNSGSLTFKVYEESLCTFSGFDSLQDTTRVCGISATLDAGGGYSSYLWNTGATTQAISPTRSGFYKVTVTNVAGCTASDSTVLSVVNANILQSDTIICKGNSVMLSVDSLLGSANRKFLLFLDGQLIASKTDIYATEQIGNGLNDQPIQIGGWGGPGWSGPGGIQVEYFKGFIDEVRISTSARYISNFNPQSYFNPDIYTKVLLHFDEGNGINTFDATTNVYIGSLLGNTTWSNATNSGTGKSLYFDGDGDYVRLNNPGSLIFPASQDFTIECWVKNNGDNIGRLVTNRSITTNGNSWISLAFGVAHDLLPQVSSGYSVEIRHTNSSANNFNQLYSNDNEWHHIAIVRNISNLPRVKYLWSTGDTTTTINVSPTQTTTYYVTVADGISSCMDSVKITVSNVDTSLIVLDPPQICTDGGQVRMQAGAASTYQWLFNGSTITGAIFQNYTSTQAGIFSVALSNIPGCRDTSRIVLLQLVSSPNLIVSKSNDIDCANDKSQLQVTGANKYSWSPISFLDNPNSANPIANPILTTIYTVTGIDNNGCANSDTITVNVDFLKAVKYFVANAFTPNNDGLNDCFKVKYWGKILEFEISIYNKWGQMVFHSTDPSKCWDGNLKGVKQKSDTYVYWIRSKTSCIDKIFKKGTIVLIR